MAGITNCPERLLLEAVIGEDAPEYALAAAFQPGNEAVLGELRVRIGCLLGRLPFRERSILEMRFGLGDGYAYTLAQTGYVFRLTRERVRQIQARTLYRLKDRAGDVRQLLDRVGGECGDPGV
jgi:DNA-directed RNA polymerase sigma subunit (sigma70/sigma32)